MEYITDYVLVILFFIILGLFYYFFGTAILKNKEKVESTRVITGFLFHTFPLVIIGIIFQALRFEWMIYYYITLIWFIICILFILYTMKNKNIKLFRVELQRFIKQYWFFIVIIIVFAITLLCNAGRIWADNLTDDGYYLVRIANLPYLDKSFSYNVTSGYESFAINSYTLNTWELEASVYLYILKVLPTIFVRFGMSIFNFFLIICGFHSLVSKINNKFNLEIKSDNIQYYCFILVTVLYGMTTLSSSFLSIDIEDTWKNTSAMYYGSTLVRLLLPLNLIGLMIHIDKIKIREIVILFIISVVYVSRSTVAIPFIYLLIISYILYYVIKNKKWLLCSLILIVLISSSFILSDNSIVANLSINRIINNTKSPVTVFISILSFVLIISYKRYNYFLIFIPILISYSLILLEPVNNIYELICNYDFVSGRVISSLYFIFYSLIMIYIIAYIFKNTKIKKHILTSLSVFCVISIILTQNLYGDLVLGNSGKLKSPGIKKSLVTLKNNKALTPDSTINVGKKIHELEQQKKGQLSVITTFDWQNIDGYAHYPALTYRAYAHNILNYTACFRVGEDNKDYSWKEHVSMCDFANNPSIETFEKVQNILERMKFDCIVSNNIEINKYINDNYILYDTVIDNNQVNTYYLFSKK